MGPSTKNSIIILVAAILSCASSKSIEKVEHNNFQPSNQVIFRRSDDGELLLPAVSPFIGNSANLDTSASNVVNNYYSKPSYGQQQPQLTCLLRTCDQVITGRDLTYDRALEIVQSEEYLVAVDADLIRRRQDFGYGNGAMAGLSYSLEDQLKLQQLLAASVNKRHVREADFPTELENEELMMSLEEPRIFNISTSGFGTISYDWTKVADNYLRLGTAAALLLAASAFIPAPKVPILPIDLPNLGKNKASNIGLDDDLRLIQAIPDDYDDTSRMGSFKSRNSMKKLPQNQILKRINKIFDPLGFLRTNKNANGGKRRKRQKKHNKRQNEPQSQKRPSTTEIPLKIPTEIEALRQKNDDNILKELDTTNLNNPFLSDSEFKTFFPSWSRKKRATSLVESRIFNVTGFGTITYPWTSVIDTYVKYALVGGLFVAAAAAFNEPKQAFNNAFQIPRLNTVNLPPNLPPGGIPPGNPLPGTPGGGGKPVGSSQQAQQALALTPPGTLPVSIFPPYATPRTVPAVSVIFLETPTPGLVRRSIWGNFGRLARSYKCLFRRKKRQASGSSYGAPSYNAPDCDYDHLRYGFRTRVTLVENQSCILGVSCTATGDKINVAALSRLSGQFAKRQSGEEFRSDAPPECRAIRDPANTCLNYYSV